ncbi:hypothetical protein MATL_G00252580 [Megalops atlanticus]|uniref:Uncharacterized protein n=1 Tax=Megalops atlanticus TaxID=7932 RepID=A0A9D3T033_MEGAT|nr:hypothetical protein MATL_G00252580 [Megalops atlanticus]
MEVRRDAGRSGGGPGEGDDEDFKVMPSRSLKAQTAGCSPLGQRVTYFHTAGGSTRQETWRGQAQVVPWHGSSPTKEMHNSTARHGTACAAIG